jgi:RNA polymerase sigma factor (sigma-70 family)
MTVISPHRAPRARTAVTPTARAPQPFSVFFREQAPSVARLLTALVARDDVEEVLQETFVAALGAYDRFDGANPRAWVLAIARRKAIDEYRSRGRRPLPVPDAGLDRAAATGDPARLSAGIWADVAELPDKQRAAVVLRFALDLRHREIGEVLGCSEAAARRNVHEGVAKLREKEQR